MAAFTSRVAVAAATLALACLASRPAHAQAWSYVTSWGTLGVGAVQFNEPNDVAVCANGDVLVADTKNHRIERITASGGYIVQWGGLGSAPGQLNTPMSLAIDATGRVFVSDFWNHRVQVFDTDGNLLGGWGTLGDGPGQLHNPSGIAVDGANNVFVADLALSRIQRFSATGTWLGGWMIEPPGCASCANRRLAVDGSGHVFTTDINTQKVSEYSYDGTLLAKWGTTGGGPGELNHPSDLLVLPNGMLLVLDGANFRFSRYTVDGNFQGSTHLVPPASPFGYPLGFARGPNGELYIADTASHRIQKYVEVAVPAQATSWGRLKAARR